MPRQVLLALIIEAALIVVTVLLLTQPRPIFHPEGEGARRALTMGGMVFLCLTFCWSFIFGAIISLNQLVLRI